MAELKHRIGNLLTVVQAIARQTFKEADAGRVEDFNARMIALAAAQALLLIDGAKPARLRDVIVAALAPHCSDGVRCSISGPLEVALDGPRAHALTLALHELATNAAKYGALSVETGWIEVSWTHTTRAFKFSWRESGGPPVIAPAQNGFGVRLITTNLAAAFDGEVDLIFDKAGFVCRLSAVLD